MTRSASADAAAANGASRWIRPVIVFAMLGLALGFGVFAVSTPSYRANAVVDVSSSSGTINDEVAIVQSAAVLDVAESLVGFRPNISVAAAEIAGSLTITATQDTAQDAAAAANAVADTYVQAQLGGAATIAGQAQVPQDRNGSGPVVFAGLGAILGAAAGFAVAAVKQTRIDHAPTLAARRSLPPTMPSSGAEPPLHVAAVTHPPAVSSPVSSASTAASNPPASAPLHNTTGLMTSTPSSFSDAAKSSTAEQPAWLTDPSVPIDLAQLSEIETRAMQSQHESERYELLLGHNETIAQLTADHERNTSELRTELARLKKQTRIQAIELKNRSGSDQSRVGDLEIQVDALEVELAALRQTLESERIVHTRRLTDERGAADRALDNTRREYRDELGKHVHSHRQTLAEYRADLDAELADDRARHAAALAEQHDEYERQLHADRERAAAKLAGATERFAREAEALRVANRQELDRQAKQHKATISELRDTGESTDSELQRVEKANQTLRLEVSTLQKQAIHSETERASAERHIAEELALTRTELEGERERNVALRADVLRRSAEAHQAIDKAVEERTAQLTELEASVSRQRQYADTRVREVSAAAEEQARQAASREASLTTTISRLKREVEEAKRQAGTQHKA